MKNRNKINRAIHVCLVSKQTVPNIVPLLLERPGMVILLETDAMGDQAGRIGRIARSREIKTKRIIIRPYDFENVEATCEKICRQYNHQDLTLNVTGGTKISALAAFESFYSAGKRIIYLNTAGDELLVIAPARQTVPVPNVIGVRDYLESYGMRQKTPAQGVPDESVADRRQCTKNLARLLIDQRPGFVSELNRKTAPYNQVMPSNKYVHFHRGDLGVAPDQFRKLLIDGNLAVPGVDGSLNINTVPACRYLSGGWLEEFVYHTLRQLEIKQMDIRLNVEVSWGKSSRSATANEFDVLFTHRNRLHIVSCKTGDLDRKTESGTKGKEALYELDSLADKAGGTFARPMLVSVRPLSDASCNRARRMGIKIVDGRRLLILRTELRGWILT